MFLIVSREHILEFYYLVFSRIYMFTHYHLSVTVQTPIHAHIQAKTHTDR